LSKPLGRRRKKPEKSARAQTERACAFVRNLRRIVSNPMLMCIACREYSAMIYFLRRDYKDFGDEVGEKFISRT